MSCGVGHRHSLNLVLLWLLHRPAAIAPIRPLAWELPYTMGATLEKIKQKQKVHAKTESQTSENQRQEVS